MTLKELFEETIFVFGAGASMDAGCLSSKQMLSDLSNLKNKDFSSEKNFEQYKDQFSDIHDFIMQSLLYQRGLKNPELKISEIMNIEDFVLVLRQMIDREYIIPSPLVGNWNNKITLWESQNKDILRKFLDFIINCLINKWTQFDDNKAENLLEPFKKVIQSSESFDLKIFSLNYDTMFEKIFNTEDEFCVNTGFSRDQWVGDFKNPHNPEKLKLYKLHGSVNWYFDEDEEIIKQGDFNDIHEKPFIIFGSGSKIQSYDPFLSLLGCLSEALKSAKLFVVVGYSFQDRYINNILIQSLKSDLNKKMLVVDPNVEKKKKEEFIKRVELFQKSKSMDEIVSLTKINPDKIKIESLKSIDFFREYLKNDCKKLKDLLNSIQIESIF